MNFEHYKNFITIVECRSISAAAKQLHIAQSALSKQVKDFEDAFGSPLLIRGARAVEPTDAGRILYEAARNMARLDASAQKEIRDCGLGRRGTLKIGLTPAFPDEGIEALLYGFAEKNPFVSYEIYEATTGDLVEMLQHGVLEVAIIRTPAYLPSCLEVARTTSEDFYVFRHPDAPFLANVSDSITLEQLRDVPLSIPRGFRTLIAESCRKHDFEPLLYSISSSRRATLMWAEAGRAVAILSEDRRPSPGQGALIPCRIQDADMAAKRSVVTLRGRPRSSVAQWFLDNAAPDDTLLLR